MPTMGMASKFLANVSGRGWSLEVQSVVYRPSLCWCWEHAQSTTLLTACSDPIARTVPGAQGALSLVRQSWQGTGTLTVSGVQRYQQQPAVLQVVRRGEAVETKTIPRYKGQDLYF